MYSLKTESTTLINQHRQRETSGHTHKSESVECTQISNSPKVSSDSLPWLIHLHVQDDTANDKYEQIQSREVWKHAISIDEVLDLTLCRVAADEIDIWWMCVKLSSAVKGGRNFALGPYILSCDLADEVFSNLHCHLEFCFSLLSYPYILQTYRLSNFQRDIKNCPTIMNFKRRTADVVERTLHNSVHFAW